MKSPSALPLAVQPQLTVVIPTWNEVGNVALLLEKIALTLKGIDWEIIFVDDNSKDGTANKIRELASKNRRVRLISRISRKGLSSACIEGMLASMATYVAVMDADLQHDESLLLSMLQQLEKGDVDLVVASRKVEQGSFGDMPHARVKISEFATQLTNRVLKTSLSDPMSGFFMLKHKIVVDAAHKLYGQGFKILLDICANADQPLRISELPYSMRARNAGESKLSFKVVIDFGVFLVSTLFGSLFPKRFIKFALIGATGVVVNMLVLGLLHKGLDFSFLYAQTMAIYVAMTSNYYLNNRFTFAAKQKIGKQFWTGLFNFMCICSIGALIGVTLGQVMHNNNIVWWLAGFCSTLLAALWNFSVSSIFTWRS